MTFSIHGLAVSKGVAIGRAVLVASSRMDVAHYFIDPTQVPHELMRVSQARDSLIEEIGRLQININSMGPKETPQELSALLDVHLMLINDVELEAGVKHWIEDRHYNGEWALTAQLEVISRTFDEMEDEYLRERKADLEQIVERLLRAMRGIKAPLGPGPVIKLPSRKKSGAHPISLSDTDDVPLILVAHDLSPADMIHFKQSAFCGFVTDVGGKTSHTAIVARSLDIPAVVGAKTASQLVRQDDWVIIDGDAGVVIVDPSEIILADYSFKQREGELQRSRLLRLLHTPAITLDGEKVDLLANIELPADAITAVQAGAVGVGLFRSEFLFMGREGHLPDEEEQYLAYKAAVDGMSGMPVTIRTVDIGSDKPLDSSARADMHLNPALGLRAIRWSLSEPAMFKTQLRAILRAAAHGPIHLLIPMLAHRSEILQTIESISQARSSLELENKAIGIVKLGAMIEIPAAALMLPTFLKYFDFLSLGTNDLIQYTLAIDRADEKVAHLYDPLHPAVLQLVANTIRASQEQGKALSLCGEMAGDTQFTRLLLGLGLRSFSMHPSQILTVKQEVLRSDTRLLKAKVQAVLLADEPALELAKLLG